MHLTHQLIIISNNWEVIGVLLPFLIYSHILSWLLRIRGIVWPRLLSTAVPKIAMGWWWDGRAKIFLVTPIFCKAMRIITPRVSYGLKTRMRRGGGQILLVNIWIFFQITPILYNTTFRTITPKLLHGLGTRIRGGFNYLFWVPKSFHFKYTYSLFK